MADALLAQVQELFEGQIVSSALTLFLDTGRPFIRAQLMQMPTQDFEGQKQTEQFTTIILSATGVRSLHTTIPLPAFLKICIGSCLHRWVPAAKHMDHSMDRARRHLASFPYGRSTISDV